ncbi:MAG: tetratricopeptide repeat protein [Thermanaerothrix sp.]|nr:tetratricopeptide repeat protein [Thermanaerothrix sp.]
MFSRPRFLKLLCPLALSAGLALSGLAVLSQPAEAKIKVRAVKRPSAGVRVVRAAQRRDPLMTQAWRGGQQLVGEGRLKEAVRYLRAYLSVMPRSSDGWFWLGRAYMAMGDFERARNAFQRTLAVDPYYPSLQPDRLDDSGIMPLWPEITPPETD